MKNSEMKKPEGIFPALVTPFDAEGRVNTEMLQRLVEDLSRRGAAGFYVGGSTAESYLLTPEERMLILEAVREACGPEMPVLANIGMLATKQSVELARHAEKVGAAAISAVPPFYFSFGMEEYYQYYRDLAEAVSVPVLIYNIPAMSGIRFDMEDLERLLSLENVMGLKHTSFDLFQLQLLVQRFPDKTAFIGQDEVFLEALAAGVRAGIGSTYNIMPEKFLRMMELAAAGRYGEALDIQGEVNAVLEALSRVGIFKGIKAALELQGKDCGFCRRPFLPLEKEQIRGLEKVLAENGVL